MTQTSESPLRKSALASGMLTQEQLRQAEAAVRSDLGAGHEADEVSDERLAAQLVQLGLLNRWQAEQLRSGRSKFTLGPYHVIDSLGQGGMGQVFKAEHTLMGRTVAIKVLPHHKSTPLAITSFTREIRAQAQLDHDNLVRAFDAGHDGNVYFMVTEYVPGTDLRKLVRARGRLTMQEAATIVSQAAAGLSHAHSRGLVHRDVKPGNLLVTPAGHTKLSDLGLASFLGEELQDDPRAGRVLGTADYLSPEHILSPRELKPVSDIYSLGRTLYYAVTGKVPYPGGTTKEKARRHCDDAPLNPRRINPDLDEDFVEVLAAMMEKNPVERIQTAEEVIERLSPWAAETVLASLEAIGHGPRSSSRLISRTPSYQPSDTQPDFTDSDPAEGSSPSQVSRGTEPFSAAAQETLPADDLSIPIPGAVAEFPLGLAMALAVPMLMAAFVLLVSLVLKMVW